jgi:hypothetical protein
MKEAVKTLKKRITERLKARIDKMKPALKAGFV